MFIHNVLEVECIHHSFILTFCFVCRCRLNWGVNIELRPFKSLRLGRGRENPLSACLIACVLAILHVMIQCAQKKLDYNYCLFIVIEKDKHVLLLKEGSLFSVTWWGLL
ncbi:uncharacterized protein LOC123918245 [Trifolium pratense]|uniref:uncharacterized protein LOC123918245 n=1 Tax=Trifolium pratense TaxID=57577 RepID=UPI001E690C50|nr:uncharacterized protein LOC123918245 [Trifolium pratense]